MKEVTMFMFEGCPHCRRANEIMKDLFAAHPEYTKVPLVIVDEKIHPEIADKYDYYYVPSFFAGDVKLHEGVPATESLENVFKTAYCAADGCSE